MGSDNGSPQKEARKVSPPATPSQKLVGWTAAVCLVLIMIAATVRTIAWLLNPLLYQCLVM